MAISEPASEQRRAFDLDLSRRLARALDSVSARPGRACALLVVVALLAFLPGFFSIPPIDRDEARFAQASKQMLETGNYVDIRFQEQARHKKPVGIHWLQVAAVRAGESVMGPSALTTIWLYRIPSLLAAVGAVLLTYWTALAFASRRGAVLAGLLMASCVLLGVEARLAKTDAVLLFSVLASVGALAHSRFTPPADKAGAFRLAALFWTGLALGILVKGPIAPLFVGLLLVPLFIRDRSFAALAALRPLAGIAWCLLLVLPWFIAIYVVTKGAFYQQAVGVDMLGKVTDGQEGHWGPPGTYLLLVWGTYWPAVALAAMSVPFAWRQRRDPKVSFLLFWLVPAWVVFEIAATKLPHYVLPLYPAFAILSVVALERGGLENIGRRWSDFIRLWPVLALVLALVFGAGFVWLGGPVGAGIAAGFLLVAAVAMLVAAVRSYRNIGLLPAIPTAVLGALVLYLAVFQLMLPQMQGLWLSPRLAVIAKASGCPAGNIAAVGYHEPSLVFLAGTDIRLTNPAKALEMLKSGGCALAFVGDRAAPAFAAAAAKAGLSPLPGETVKGFAYNGGRAVSVTVYRPGARP